MNALRILVTGGAGFIGAHLCRRLAAEGHEVVALDLRLPEAPVHGVDYLRGDVRLADDLAGPVSGADAVFHLAAVVSVPLCEERPEESHATNFLGTCRVLEAVRAANARRERPIRIVFASSAAVYGHLGAPHLPLDEDLALPTPLSLYAAQKRFSEVMLRMYRERHGVPSVALRFFNVYGPGQDPSSPYSGVISIFDARVAQGKALSLHGGGRQTRDFVSVHDLVDAGAKALSLPDEACDARPINLGGGVAVTIAGLAEEIMRAAGRDVPVQVTGPRGGDVQHSLASIARAAEVLGWRPRMSLGEGLRELRRASEERTAA